MPRYLSFNLTNWRCCDIPWAVGEDFVCFNRSPSKHLLSPTRQLFQRIILSFLKHNFILMAASRINKLPVELQDMIYGLALLFGNTQFRLSNEPLEAWQIDPWIAPTLIARMTIVPNKARKIFYSETHFMFGSPSDVYWPLMTATCWFTTVRVSLVETRH